MNRYKNTEVLKTKKDTSYYSTTLYPIIFPSQEDTYVTTTIGDKYDTLAFEFYGDSSLWWVILSANNNLPKDSLYPPPGTILRIPGNISNILNEYRSLNNL